MNKKENFKKLAMRARNLETALLKFNNKFNGINFSSDEDLQNLVGKFESAVTEFYRYAKNKYDVDSIYQL